MPRSWDFETAMFRQAFLGLRNYLGLFSSAPGPRWTSAEQTGPGYARQEVELIEVASLVATNLVDITFSGSGLWPASHYFGIFSLQNVLLYWDRLEPFIALPEGGGQAVIKAGALSINFGALGTLFAVDVGRGLETHTGLLATELAPFQESSLEQLHALPSEMLVASDTKRGRPWSGPLSCLRRRGLVDFRHLGTVDRRRLVDKTTSVNVGMNVVSPEGLAF